MKTLLWKDYRVNRVILIGGLVMLLVPYVLVVPYGLLDPDSNKGMYSWWDVVGRSVMLSLLTIAFLGGNAFAGERMDRSAEFLAYLPPSRWAIVASKTLLALLVAAAIWGFTFLILHAAASVDTEWGVPVEVVQAMVGTMVMLYGTAWLFSAILTSPAIATCCGIGITAIAAFVITRVGKELGFGTKVELFGLYSVAASILGLLCYAAGVLYYLRRAEP